jgi:hypothetical protein
MEQSTTTPGSLDRQEKAALEDSTRREILDLMWTRICVVPELHHAQHCVVAAKP